MELVIATHNLHKVKEFERILKPLNIKVITADISEPEETGKTFMENAFIKAEAACKETGLPAVADDSGICVDALDGAPGIYSARYGGDLLDDRGRVRLLLFEMEHIPKEARGAHFTSAICCVFPDGSKLEAEGRCYGEIGYSMDGDEGFGYDPIFLQDGVSFGKLSGEEKDKRSHRGKSLKLFAEKLSEHIKNKS